MRSDMKLISAFLAATTLSLTAAMAQNAGTAQQTSGKKVQTQTLSASDSPDTTTIPGSVKPVADQTLSGTTSTATPASSEVKQSAQAQAQSSQPQSSQSQVTSEAAPQAQALASNMVGKPLKAIDGGSVGEVSKVVSTPTGRVAGVEAKVGGFLGFGQKTVLIPASQLDVNNDAIVVAMTEEQIKQLDEPVTTRSTPNAPVQKSQDSIPQE